MKKALKYLIYFFIIVVIGLFITGKINQDSFSNGSLNHTSSWQGEFLEINGEKIRYLQKGKGQDILLIHGTPGSIEDWKPIIDSLSEQFRITVFDRPGHGFSTANNYNYTIKENAIIVQQLINQLQLDSILVIGHSYGGSIAAHLATINAPKIKSYIIIASPLYQFNPQALYKLVSTPIIDKGITTIIAKTVASDKIEDGLSAAFNGNTTFLSKSFLSIRKQLWSQPKVLYATAKERINYSENLKEVSNNYKTISKKVSILLGTKDNPTIIEDCKKLASDIPNAEIHIFKNTAHYIQFERTRELLNIIKNHAKNK